MDIKRYCEKQQIKLTPLRTKILDIILGCEKPVTAYEILEILQKDKPKAQVMSVYRIINFLLSQGLIHRIESLNAVMVCNHLETQHISQWLICSQCETTKEYAAPAVDEVIKSIESETGFYVTSPTVELLGLCADCKE